MFNVDVERRRRNGWYQHWRSRRTMRSTYAPGLAAVVGANHAQQEKAFAQFMADEDAWHEEEAERVASRVM